MADYSLLLFILSSMVIILSPGQDMVLVISNSIARGRLAGIATTAGVSVALLGHTILVTLGLGALLQASPLAFNVMKYVGAAYLLYLGYKSFTAKPINLSENNTAKNSLASIFMMGVLSNITNPKVAIFYFAYLPQFISPESTTPNTDLFVLGCVFAAVTFFSKLPVGLIAGSLSQTIQKKPSIQLWINRTCGSVLIAMSIKLAVGI